MKGKQKKWFSKMKSYQLSIPLNLSHSLKPTDECKYLGVILDKELTFQKQRNNDIRKMALAIRPI